MKGDKNPTLRELTAFGLRVAGNTWADIGAALSVTSTRAQQLARRYVWRMWGVYPSGPQMREFVDACREVSPSRPSHALLATIHYAGRGAPLMDVSDE